MKPEKMREFLMNGAVLVVQLTPFKSNGKPDLDGLKENTRFLVEKAGTRPLVLVPTGSTGEHYTLLDEERKTIIKTVVDEVNGKLPVIAGTGHSGTVPTIEYSRFAQDVGADAVMIVLPYYHVPEEEGLYQHYKKSAEALDIGVFIYNNADVSKIYIKPELMKRIVDNIPNIIGIKENAMYPPTLYAQIKTVGEKVPILQGRGEFWFAATVFLGVRGFISGHANFMPDFSLNLLETGLAGDFIKLKQMIQSIDPYDDFIAKMDKKYGPSTSILPFPYVGSYMIYGVFKATMDMLGLNGKHMRLPLQDLKKEDEVELERIVFDILNLEKIK